MDQTKQKLSFLYAKAFLKSFDSSLSDAVIKNLRQQIGIMEKNKECLFLIDRVFALSENPQELLQNITNQYQLPVIFEQLLLLLAHHKRVFIFSDVVRAIIDLYYQQKNIKIFTISSMPQLNDQEQKKIKHFIEQHFGHGHIFIFKLDPTLIAGIRIQSTSTIWEYSCARQLREMSLSLI